MKQDVQKVLRGLGKPSAKIMIPMLEMAQSYCEKREDDVIPRAVWILDEDPTDASVVGWTIIPKKEAV